MISLHTKSGKGTQWTADHNTEKIRPSVFSYISAEKKHYIKIQMLSHDRLLQKWEMAQTIHCDDKDLIKKEG